jgi:D-xylose transport system permease protein
MNDVFAVADRLAVLRHGRMVDVRPIDQSDQQIAVDLMTSGTSTRVARPAKDKE